MDNINVIINRCGFCSVEKREFIFEKNQTIPYYCCKRCKGSSKCNKNCDKCKEIFARYIVINLLDENILNTCNDVIFYSNDIFVKFQMEYLSSMFFYESDCVRYNIYLIFICENPNLDKYISYSLNLDYARKLFLTKSDFEKYFCVFDEIVNNTNQISTNTNSVNSVHELKESLTKKGMRSLLMDSFPENTSNTDVFYEFILSDYEHLDEYVGEYEEIGYIDNINNDFTDTKYNTRNIDKVTLDNFRTDNFEKNTSFKFGLCNIIYGENATGKTSILDAIEFGCTGETQDEEDGLSLVEICWDNNSLINSSKARNERSVIKKTWYPFEMGTLNDIFRQVNYFDIDATFNFALNPNDFELNRLFCDSELFRIQKNLLRNKTFFNFLSEFFEKHYNKFVSKENIKNKSLIFCINVLSFFTNKRRIKTNEFYRNIKRQPIKLKELMNANSESIDKINRLINDQVLSNMELINKVFSRLFSFNYEISNSKDGYILCDLNSNNTYRVNEMSTAQRVCLALSVIFAKFLSSQSAPRFILLDESVANLDSIHLLNLLDFLRDATLHGIQIFFTTANCDVCKIAKSKFFFLENDFYLYKLSKNEQGKTIVESETNIK